MTDTLRSRQRSIVRYLNNVAEPAMASVVEECWLEITCNSIHIATLAASPFDIQSLVVGYLYFRGLVKDPSEIKAMETRWLTAGERARVDVETAGESATRLRGITGAAPWVQLETDVLFSPDSPALPTTMRLAPSAIMASMRDLYSSAEHYRMSRGIHAAGISDGQRLLIIAEDLSRHGAIDKVIGRALLLGIDTSGGVLCTTGRLSSGLICRAYHAGIEIFLSRTSPTQLAMSLGERLGVTLVGYIRADGFVVYAGPDRVVA
jgi:FdhD protein